MLAKALKVTVLAFSLSERLVSMSLVLKDSIRVSLSFASFSLIDSKYCSVLPHNLVVT